MLGAGGQKRVPEDFLKDWKPLLPPVATQRRIAWFLDEKTGGIDELIGKKRELLERLAEKRQALITRAVTKGLNPDAPMKPSGIDWLGDIPAHWEILPIKFAAKIGNGSTPRRENPDYWEGGDVPWLNSSCVNLDSVSESEQFVTQTALKECHLPMIDPPAVLVGITGQGKTRGMATTLKLRTTINQHLAYIKTFEGNLATEFLRRVVDCAYDFLRSESEGGGSTKGAITCEQLGEMHIPVPPRKEQDGIIASLQAALTRFTSSR